MTTRPDTDAIRAAAAWLEEHLPSYSEHRRNLLSAADFIDRSADWYDARAEKPSAEAERCNHVFLQGGEKHCCSMVYRHPGDHGYNPDIASAWFEFEVHCTNQPYASPRACPVHGLFCGDPGGDWPWPQEFV